MITISQTFRHTLHFTSIAETFISGFGEIPTICGSTPSNAEVWIKVGYMKSHWNGGRVYINNA
jgi:hypothetical protein